jgi:hypothetical protein
MGNEAIIVRALESFTVYDHTKVLAKVEEGGVYSAHLYVPTDEYFALDKEGREFYVGQNCDGSLIINEEFELLDKDNTLRCDGCGRIINPKKCKPFIKKSVLFLLLFAG